MVSEELGYATCWQSAVCGGGLCDRFPQTGRHGLGATMGGFHSRAEYEAEDRCGNHPGGRTEGEVMAGMRGICGWMEKWLSADFADWRGFSKRRAIHDGGVRAARGAPSLICENPCNLWIKRWLSAGFLEGEQPCEMFALTGGQDYMTNNRS